MSAKLAQKTIWITGASSGIGKALVAEATKRGANVILSARNTAALKKIRTDLGLTDANSLIIPLDLKRYAHFDAAVKTAVKKFGAIDVLVNNGGISQRSLAHETDLKVYEEIMTVNYFGNIALSLAVLPAMRVRKSGIIATISSVAGKFGTPYRTGYSASKFALSGFYEGLRAENFKENIQVTIVFPGFVQTNVSLNALTGKGKKQGTMDSGQSAGISAEECARRTLNGILQGKNEVYVTGFKEKFAVYVSRFLPSLFARIIRKAKVT
jgi:dehydrogenase/reductase SDR family member 7B